MYGDTDAIRQLARQFRVRADQVRTLGGDLVRSARDVPWQGVGADRMRWSVERRSAGLRRAARAHEDAAAALDHHAAEVDRLKALIAAIERQVAALVAEARARLADLAGPALDNAVPDSTDELLDKVVAPPSGHRDWLDIDLPGV